MASHPPLWRSVQWSSPRLLCATPSWRQRELWQLTIWTLRLRAGGTHPLLVHLPGLSQLQRMLLRALSEFLGMIHVSHSQIREVLPRRPPLIGVRLRILQPSLQNHRISLGLLGLHPRLVLADGHHSLCDVVFSGFSRLSHVFGHFGLRFLDFGRALLQLELLSLLSERVWL